MENSIKAKVRSKLIQYGALLILTVCIWGHVSELFDHWDNTFQTGNDVEYSTVIVALTVGVVVALANLAGIVLRSGSATYSLVPCVAASPTAAMATTPFIGHSPPQTLRI